MCIDAVIAENTFDTTPFYVWGRNPHYWGFQPNWQVEVLANRLPHSAGITSLSCDQSFNLCKEGANPNSGTPAGYDGPLNSAVVMRKNLLSDGQGISIHGTTSDVLVESNTIHNGAGGFIKNPVDVMAKTTSKVYLRNNMANA
jgi:hypothetical protein